MLELPQAIKDTKVRLCLDCGKCTVVCPVAKYDADFNPRRIVQEALLTQGGRHPVSEKVWSCISCNMCTERCNYYVKFTDFVKALRRQSLADGVAVQYNHGGTPQSIMHIMGQGGIKQDRMSWLPKDIKVARTSDTAFFVGCTPYFDVLFSDLGVNTTAGSAGALRILNRAGIPFTVLPNERCCGHDLLDMGDAKGFKALARANQRELKRKGIKKIITACPEGYYTLKYNYPKYLDGWDVEVQHMTEVATELIDAGKLKPGKLKKKLKVTYHDPCSLGRYARIFEPPRRILEAIGGLEIVEMADNRETALCCGASPWAYCGTTNKQIQKERLSQADATGADVLVTACPKCQIHLKCAQKNAEGSGVCQIEIRDIFDILAESLAQEVSRNG